MIVSLVACNQQPDEEKTEAEKKISKRDYSITKENSYSDLFLDSLAMEKYIAEHKLNDSLSRRMRSFYNTRNYQFAWFFEEGMADYASSFHDVYNDYINYSQDTALRNPFLEQFYDSLSNGNFNYDVNDSIVLNAEILLTAQFFRYTRRAYQGSSQLDAQELDWFIPRKKIDPSALLDSVLSRKGRNLKDLEPVNRQYNLLKNFLLKY